MNGASDFVARMRAAKAEFSLHSIVAQDVKLKRAGREFSGCCPFHDEKTPSFRVVEDKGFFHCFGCGAHGDLFDYLRHARGMDLRGALAFLGGDAAASAMAPAAKRASLGQQRPNDMVESRLAALAVWNGARPARGSLAEAFLRTRGIDPAANGLLDLARYYPHCPAGLWRRWEGPMDARRHAPALVAPMLKIEGGRGERALSFAGVHLTFLEGDGAKKRFEPWQSRDGKWHEVPSRVMWGASARAAVPILPKPLKPGQDPREELRALLDRPEAGLLVVGEGLESTQSLMAREPATRLGFAALSLNNLQGAAGRVGKRDAIALHNPQPAWTDGEGGERTLRGAAFTVAEPGKVLVGVDADMKATQHVWVQDRRGEPAVKRVLTGRERSELCGALAAAQWRLAGAERVTIKRPAMGSDFNDSDREGGNA